MLIVQWLALALALAGFLMAAAVENRLRSFARPPKEKPRIVRVPQTLPAE
jgi:hypothetical protein